MADISKLDEKTFLAAMTGVPTIEIDKNSFVSGVTVIDLAAMHDKVPSKTEARKLIKSNGFSINKEKMTNEKSVINEESLIGGKYLILTKGKKDYNLVTVKC